VQIERQNCMRCSFKSSCLVLTTDNACAREHRLNALSPELKARESEVNSLRERVRAELDAARQLASSAAVDRAQVIKFKRHQK